MEKKWTKTPMDHKKKQTTSKSGRFDHKVYSDMW